MFTPPVTGIYLLSLYAKSFYDQDGMIYVKSNDRILCEVYIGDPDDIWESMSCTTVVELMTGDSIRVTGSSTSPARLEAPFAGFSGYLVQAYAKWLHFYCRCLVAINRLHQIIDFDVTFCNFYNTDNWYNIKEWRISLWWLVSHMSNSHTWMSPAHVSSSHMWMPPPHMSSLCMVHHVR